MVHPFYYEPFFTFYKIEFVHLIEFSPNELHPFFYQWHGNLKDKIFTHINNSFTIDSLNYWTNSKFYGQNSKKNYSYFRIFNQFNYLRLEHKFIYIQMAMTLHKKRI